MNWNSLIVILLTLNASFCLAEGDGESAVLDTAGNSVRAKSGIMSHLGITVNVSEQTESREAYVAPGRSVPRPRARPTDSDFTGATVTEAVDAINTTNPTGTRNTTGSRATNVQSQTTEAAPSPTQQSQYQNQNGYTPQNTGAGQQAAINTGGGVTPAAVNVQQPIVIQKMVYSDDDKDKSNDNKSNTKIINTRESVAKDQRGINTPVANTKRSKSEPDNPTVINPSNAPKNPTLFGQYSSGGRKVKKASNKAGNDNSAVAGKALKKMWKGYHGAGGSKGSRRGRYKGRRKGSKYGRNLASTSGKSKKDKNSKRLLADYWNTKLRRGIASASSGYSDKNVFLFSSMCGFYQNFAKEIGSNAARTKCPKP